ncbi:MAG TPA: hypothetical protein V6D00_03185 [Pantanalinema sp.]
MPEPTPHAPTDPFSDELLAELVVGARLMSERELNQARARLASGEAGEAIPYAHAFVADPTANGLVALVPSTQEVGARIALGEDAPPPDLADWPPYSTGDVLVLSTREPGIAGAIQVGHRATLGLIPTARGAFLYPGAPPTQAQSPRMATLLAPVVSPSASKTHPIDFAVSTGGEFVLAANRGAGTVHVVVANTCQQAGAIMLRAAGSRRAMGMALDRKVAYLTDGMTPRLTVLDLLTLKVRHQPFPTGPLGPVALTPDGSHLLVVFYKAGDELGLLMVSTADLRVRHLMNLPAHKLTEGPGEAIVVTPDGALAYILAAGESGAPKILAFDPLKRKLVAEIPLIKPPLGLAFAPPADWLPPRPTLEDVIVQMGFASREELRALQLPEDEVSPLMDPGLDPLILSQLPERLIRTMGMVPLMRDATHLSVAMLNPRDAACQQLAIQLAGGLNLRIIPIEQEELDRFMAERYPALMESFLAMRNAAPVVRPPGGTAPEPGAAPSGPRPGGPSPAGPSPGGPRPGGPSPGGPSPGGPRPGASSSVGSTPGGAEPAGSRPGGPVPAGPLPGGAGAARGPAPAPSPAPPPVAPPGPSPAARAAAPAQGEAAPMPSMTTAIVPQPPALGSIEALVAGNGRRLLVIENLKRQVTQIDRDRPETWTFKDVVAGSACYLPSGRLLFADLGQHRVIEVDPLSSKVVWAFGESSDRTRTLRAPRWAGRLAGGHTLVADTGNHRVVEVSPEGEIAWSHGETGRAGCAGQALFKPHSAVRTPEGGTLIADTGNHRVIEVDEAGAVVWQYGNGANRLGGNQGSGPNQLSEPAWAARLPNGHTLIADTGNGRVIELDAEKALVWQYRAGAARGGTPVKDPCGAARLANGNTLVLGRQGAVEVDPELTIVWEHHPAPREGTAPLSALVPAAHPAYQPIISPEALVPLSEPARMPEPAPVVAAHRGSELPANLPDSVLLADRTGGRVLEIDRKMQIFWQFSGIVGGGGNRLLAPNYVTRLPNGGTLVADTGNHRVVEVRDQSIVWQFGKPGEAGSGPRHLSQPRSVERTLQGTMLIADFGNRRVVEVTVAGDVRWGREGFKGPSYASRLPSGNTLVCDWADHQVLEIDPRGTVVWSFGQSGFGGPGSNQLYHPEHAVRLENGNTLIADTQNHRVVEVSPAHEIVWQYGGDAAFLGRKGRFGIQLNTPIIAWRLSEGTTLVVHAGKNHVVELDAELNILWHFTLAQDRR